MLISALARIAEAVNGKPLWRSFAAAREIHPNDSPVGLSKTEAPTLENLPDGLDIVRVRLAGAPLEVSDGLR